MKNPNPAADNDLAKALLLAVLIAVFLMILMPATMLWDRDETLYARTAVEMLGSGNFIKPTFNGEVFAHKPPMIYWLMALSFAVFGENEFAARFISAPALAGSAFVTYLIGRRMYDSRVGLWAMVVLATVTMGVYIGAAAMLDAALLFFICLALYAYVEMVYRPELGGRMMALFFVAILLSMFVKGPVGPAVVCSTILFSWLAMPRDARPPFARMAALAGLAIGAFGLFLTWVIPADVRSGGEFMTTGVGYHIIQRALTPLEGHGGSGVLGYLATMPVYIPVVLVGFFPWVMYLPAALARISRGDLGTLRARALLLSWVIPTFVLFSVAATKLPHYVLPIFPALAIAAAAMMVRLMERETAGAPDPAGRWLVAGRWIYAGGGFSFVAALIVAPFVLPSELTLLQTLPLALTIGVATTFALRALLRGGYVRANWIIAAVTPLGLVYTLWVVVPAVEPMIKISRPIGDLVRANVTADTDVYMVGFAEPSLVFYVRNPHDRPLRGLPYNDAGFAEMSRLTGDVIVVSTLAAFESANALTPDAPLEEIGRFAAFNTNRGSRLQEIIVSRRVSGNVQSSMRQPPR